MTGAADTQTATVAGSEFAKAIKFAFQPVERKGKGTIPILQTVMLKFEPGRMVATGTDLDIWCEYGVEAEADKRFAFCLTVKTLAGILAVSGGEQISFALDEAQTVCTVSAGDFTGTFMTIFPAVDFPVFMEEWITKAKEPSGTAEIPEGRLWQILRDAIPCISAEETRYYLNGAYLHQRDGRTLKVVTTDGHRLSFRKTDIKWPAALNAIVPTKTIKILHATQREGGNGTVRISGNARYWQIASDADTWKIGSKTIDGTYPDYTRVIPKAETNWSAPISLGMINRAMAFAGRRRDGESYAVQIAAATGRLSLRLNDKSEVGFPITGTTGDVTAGFNGFYLRDFLRLHSPAVIASHSAGDPAFIKTEDPDLTQILMPMRV